MIAQVLRDVAGLTRVCGVGVAVVWLTRIVQNLKTCVRSRSLQSADEAMGPGPFRCSKGNAVAVLSGDGVLGGIREIWARDCYLRAGALSIPPGAMVVDLGANMGNFVLRALAEAQGVRVAAIEPGLSLCQSMRAQLEANDWADRCEIVRAWLGGLTTVQHDMLLEEEYRSAEHVSPVELVRRLGVRKIDFLKCDIEGSEFNLFLSDDNILLRMAERVAIEIHFGAGDANTLIGHLEREGFVVVARRIRESDGVWLLRKRACTK